MAHAHWDLYGKAASGSVRTVFCKYFPAMFFDQHVRDVYADACAVWAAGNLVVALIRAGQHFGGLILWDIRARVGYGYLGIAGVLGMLLAKRRTDVYIDEAATGGIFK